jgi:hypothetical protein
MKPVRILFWANQYRPLKIVTVDIEVDIPLTPQPMEPLDKEFPELLLEAIYHRHFDVFIPSE